MCPTTPTWKRELIGWQHLFTSNDPRVTYHDLVGPDNVSHETAAQVLQDKKHNVRHSCATAQRSWPQPDTCDQVSEQRRDSCRIGYLSEEHPWCNDYQVVLLTSQ